MAGREVREYTNLSDPKDKKLGKGKDKIDDEDITFYEDLINHKEQMEAEDDAERLLWHTEKHAFAAFKKVETLLDSSPASLPLPLHVVDLHECAHTASPSNPSNNSPMPLNFHEQGSQGLWGSVHGS
ncbi:hypothetical protein UlMin_009117 [Ulmus minor]